MRIGVVGGAAAEATARDHDASMAEEDGGDVIAPGNGLGGDGAPEASGGIADFGNGDAAGIGEFYAGGIAAEGHDFAVGEHDEVMEGAGVVHVSGGVETRVSLVASMTMAESQTEGE